MTGTEALFNLFIILAFFTSLLDHWWVGTHERINRPLRAFLLGCFIATESWVALEGRPMFFLYVALNFFGLYMLFAHKKVLLGAVWLKRRKKWFGGSDETKR